jgi:deazaflavin-dependent oxidoreductase (nitroreductase family)
VATLRRRFTRRAARAPLILYSAGLGGLLGQSFLLLEHTGRVSGLPRRTVLEVVGRLPGDRYVVASGYGERADWYRNIRARPCVHVSVGRRRHIPAVARPLAPNEAAQALEAYRAAHPWRWRLVDQVLTRTTHRPARDLLAALPLVELHLGWEGTADQRSP